MQKKIAILAVALAVGGGLYFWRKHMDKNQAHVAKILDIARMLRPAPEGQKEIPAAEVAHQIEDMLVDYTVDGDIKRTIANFLYKTVGQQFAEAQIEPLCGMPHQGMSGCPLFFVRGSDGELAYVVKTFNAPFVPGKFFLKELPGFQVVSMIHGRNFQLARLCAVGKYRIDGKQYGILAISPAQGVSIADLITNMMFARADGRAQEADRLFAMAQHAIAKLGAAFAELHHMRMQEGVGIHPSLVSYPRKKLAQFLSQLQQDDRGIDVILLQRYFDSLLQRLNKAKTMRSLIHGDPNLGNFMYDEQNDAITMVDLGGMARGADREGNPIGDAAVDVMGILDAIAAYKQYGMPEQQCESLKTAFIAGYGLLPSVLEGDYFRLYQHLRLIPFFMEIEQRDPEKLGSAREVLRFHLDEMKKAVADFQAAGE